MALNESYWTYRVERPEPHAPAELGWSDHDWNSLSPGMRRELTRHYTGKPKVTAPAFEPGQARREQRDRKAAVEYAARKRL